MLIYLHGFNSSPASVKARQLAERLRALGRADDLLTPALPAEPLAAVALAEALVLAHPGSVLVGSSLGGFYALHLAEKHRLRAVLLNPAMRPHELLAPMLGRQRNPYTGEEYELLPRHVDALRSLAVDAVADPSRYLLVTATGDEVLDWRQAAGLLRAARQVVISGGDHAMSDFEQHLDAVLAFAGAAEGARPARP